MTELDGPLVTRGEAAEYLGVHPNTITRWINRGLIEKIPGTQRMRASEIQRFAGVLSEPKTPEQRKRGRYKK